ncbi:helix-turn-helix transcriptional regulator [Phycicoccus avicenniae]|uniref:helix-turn-helix transcriptional regulator n=1 Tax=Phycicoccus avicenniae TaxID=2828860 RepID=UPI003D270257
MSTSSRTLLPRTGARAVVPWAAAGGLVLLVGSGRATGTTVPATSWWVVLGVLSLALLVRRCDRGLGTGWAGWRLVLRMLVLAALAVPAAWSVAVLASDVRPDGMLAWLTALLATTSHLPLVAAFSLLPWLATRYLGHGSTAVLPVAVVALWGLAFLAFLLVFDDYAPLRASAPLSAPQAEAWGAALHTAFLSTVLLGPALAARAAWRCEGPAARRAGLVAGHAVAGAALVMLCGALGALGHGGAVLVLVGMAAAVSVLAVGCTRALATDLPAPTAADLATAGTAGSPGPRAATACPEEPSHPSLTPREAEVVALLAQGLSNAGIAARLVVSERTVDAHLRSAFTKLDLPEGSERNRRVSAVLAWQRARPAASPEAVEEAG